MESKFPYIERKNPEIEYFNYQAVDHLCILFMMANASFYTHIDIPTYGCAIAQQQSYNVIDGISDIATYQMYALHVKMGVKRNVGTSAKQLTNLKALQSEFWALNYKYNIQRFSFVYLRPLAGIVK